MACRGRVSTSSSTTTSCLQPGSSAWPLRGPLAHRCPGNGRSVSRARHVAGSQRRASRRKRLQRSGPRVAEQADHDSHVAAAELETSGGTDVQRPVQPVSRAAIKPLAPEQYLIKFTASRATHEKLRETQALLRHQVPSGDVAEIFDHALTLLLAELRKARHAATPRPRSRHRTSNTGRYVAAAVKREVWARDGGQCAFVGTAGRCSERGFLEYHHVIPFADGGATDAANLQLRCRAHNTFEAGRWSGPGEENLFREVSPIYDTGLSLINGWLPGESNRYVNPHSTRSRT